MGRHSTPTAPQAIVAWKINLVFLGADGETVAVAHDILAALNEHIVIPEGAVNISTYLGTE